jgi:hypothetical protein
MRRIAMQVHWPSSWRPLGELFSESSSKARRQQGVQAPPEFLFEPRSSEPACADRTPGEPVLRPEIRFGSQAPYRRTRREDLVLPRTEVPALTITASPYQHVEIAGEGREDWFVRFCGCGEGNSEEEAHERLQQVSLRRSGATVSLEGPGVGRARGAISHLIVQAPAEAPVTVHASFTAVAVWNMTGPVRITAIKARATILNTTGKVDAAGFVVDFAGSEGTVILSAEAEINLKLTSPKFSGTLTACAQLPVRALVPLGFQTPFQVLVSRPQDFVCRTEFASDMKVQRNGSLYVYTYSGDGSTPPGDMSLRSEHATVVIDTGQ